VPAGVHGGDSFEFTSPQGQVLTASVPDGYEAGDWIGVRVKNNLQSIQHPDSLKQLSHNGNKARGVWEGALQASLHRAGPETEELLQILTHNLLGEPPRTERARQRDNLAKEQQKKTSDAEKERLEQQIDRLESKLRHENLLRFS